MAEAQTLLSAAQLAKLLKLSERRVNQLKSAGILTAQKEGFPLVENVQSYIEFLRKDDEKGRDAKARKETALAERAELDLAERRGDLIRVARVAKVVGDAAANAKARLRNLPGRLARAVQGKDIAGSEAIIRKGIDEALEAIANVDVQARPESAGEDSEVSPAA